MQLISLGLATAITCLALITHVTIGTAQNAAPILDDKSLPEAPRHTLTFSWKANSILMLFMSIGFGMGFVQEIGPLVLYNALLAGGLAIAASFVAIQSGLNPLKFPPMPLFTCIAFFGLCSYFL
ncbi:hypothetical protein [Planktotalea sp.]|uniref:hypothetical protein n=1 Tax=Planktotalea sp. TaxID=2029877 RepID=UPI00329A5DD3